MVTELEVVNVVGWITYRQEFDLAALAETFSDRDEISSVTYEPAKNHWLQTHFAPDDTYVAFYRSGRCSIAGAESEEHLEVVVMRINRVMQDLLEFEYEPDAGVSNIVATTDLGTTISLEHLAIELGMESVEYEPEQFPALMYRGQDEVILVFSSGKILCTGLTDRESTSKAINWMISQIQALPEL
jgi:transcription initiation factor TFIID TATA-box-binding protein